MTMLHGDVRHRTSTPHKSGNNMKNVQQLESSTPHILVKMSMRVKLSNRCITHSPCFYKSAPLSWPLFKSLLWLPISLDNFQDILPF